MQENKQKFKLRSIVKDLLITMIILVITTVIAVFIKNFSYHNYNVTIVYFLSVVIISALTSGYFYGVLASFMGMLCINYYFTYPFFAFNFVIDEYPFTFASMLVVSVITCTLTSRIKKQALIAIAKQNQTNTLLVITKRLLASRTIENIGTLIVEYIQQNFNCKAFIYTSKPSPDTAESIAFPENNIANWAYDNKTKCGKGTGFFSEANGQYIPIISENTVFGVIGLFLNNDVLSEDKKIELKMVIAIVAMAFERQQLSDEQQKILLDSEREKMRSSLLSAVSHDLRTPLTGIYGASSAILENYNKIDEETHVKLITNICEDSQWLIRMVENLLSVTRISEKTTRISKRPEAVEEIVAEAVSRIKINNPNQKIHVSVPDELLFVPMDATLIEQVIINLINNSIKHSGTASIVNIKIFVDKDFAVFEISDNGKGIDDQVLPYLFTGYQAKDNYVNDSTQGMGIGLSICNSIIKAHSGTITAENKDGGGAVFKFLLPIKEAYNE